MPAKVWPEFEANSSQSLPNSVAVLGQSRVMWANIFQVSARVSPSLAPEFRQFGPTLVEHLIGQNWSTLADSGQDLVMIWVGFRAIPRGEVWSRTHLWRRVDQIIALVLVSLQQADQVWPKLSQHQSNFGRV